MAFAILKKQAIRPVCGVLFDMDGLVLDTEKLYGRFWREAARQLGCPMTFQQSLGLRSLNSTYGQQYLEKCFGTALNYPELRNLRIRLMEDWIRDHGVEPKPGARELLEFLRQQRIPCAITTSAPAQRAKAYLEPLGLYDLFTKVCSGHDLPHGKPAPDIYLEGAAQLSIAPESCLALEDSPAGIQSACSAGCLPVVIPDQDQPDEETLNRCFAEAESLLDVIEILQILNY